MALQNVQHGWVSDKFHAWKRVPCNKRTQHQHSLPPREDRASCHTDVYTLALSTRDATPRFIADNVVTNLAQPQQPQGRVHKRVLAQGREGTMSRTVLLVVGVAKGSQR